MHISILILCLGCLLNGVLATQTATYSEQEAKTYLYASALVYCDPELIMQKNCKMATKLSEENGIEPLYAFRNNRTYNRIHYSIMERKKEKELIVTFSGTKNIEQLILEILQSYPVSYFINLELEGAKVFEYFYWFYLNEFRSDFQGKITEFMKTHPKHRVVFTGHSLGGALAMHAAIDSILNKWVVPSKILIYTYGQPRIGNHIISAVLEKEIQGYFRVVHNKDLVAHIPPCIPSLGGCKDEGLLVMHPYHGSQEIWYDLGMENYIECDRNNGEDPKCSNSVSHISIVDHQSYFGVRVGKAHTFDSLQDSTDEKFQVISI